jgi:hypothetical protein
MQFGDCPRSKEDAGRLIRECLQGGTLIPTRHFWRELEKEGLSIVDALIIIRRGHVFEEPEFVNFILHMMHSIRRGLRIHW